MEVRLLLSLKLHLSLQGDHLPHLARTRAKDERKEEDQGNPYGEGGLEELAGEILISFLGSKIPGKKQRGYGAMVFEILDR
jgi:hypothetical protein